MNKPDFWASMTAAQDIPVERRNGSNWQILERTYEAWDPARTASARIPRILHQIWLGRPLPRLYARWGETWRRRNPGWEYYLWTEKEIARFGLKNQKSFDLSPNFGVKSDLARYEILERMGGVYADTDFECLKPFEELSRSTEFFAGLMYSVEPAINNGLIGSRPGHPILSAMISDLSEPYSGSDGMGILDYSGPSRFTNQSLAFLKTGSQGAVILPTTVLYPFPNRDIELKDIKRARQWAGPDSLAIHYWEVSWSTQSLASKVYWWMKKHLPRVLFKAIYRTIKGKSPE